MTRTQKWIFVSFAVALLILLMVSAFVLIIFDEGGMSYHWSIDIFQLIVKLFSYPFAVLALDSNLLLLILLYFVDYLIYIGILGWVVFKLRK
jgi:hypothetical protein